MALSSRSLTFASWAEQAGLRCIEAHPGHALVGHVVSHAENRADLDPAETRIEGHRLEPSVAPHGPVDLGVYGLQKSLPDPLSLVFC